MPKLPASGQISVNDINTTWFTSGTQRSLSDPLVRYLLESGTFDPNFMALPALSNINLGAGYSKPIYSSASTTYSTAGTWTFYLPVYKTITIQVSGGGGGQLLWNGFFFQCVNICNSGSGNAGGQTSFNGITADGGGAGLQCSGGVGAAGGNNQNGNTGGGGTGGAGNTNPADTNCNQASGSNGGAGGYVQVTYTKGISGPAYGATINFTVGAGGAQGAASCRDQRGAAGGSGRVYLAWS